MGRHRHHMAHYNIKFETDCCSSNKRGYITMDDAKMALKVAKIKGNFETGKNESGDYCPQTIYHCNHCGYYHLTHSKSKISNYNFRERHGIVSDRKNPNRLSYHGATVFRQKHLAPTEISDYPKYLKMLETLGLTEYPKDTMVADEKLGIYSFHEKGTKVVAAV